MRIFIITMDDPVQTNQFIRHIIENKPGQVVGLAVAKGGRLSVGRNRSKLTYILSLLLIMGFPYFAFNAWKVIWFHIAKKAHALGLSGDPSILSFAKQKGIPTWTVKTPNSQSFQKEIRKLDIDVIINQCQSILKKPLLDIPKIGVINRHNALLPKNRGRLTPFWVLYKQENKTGVTIHFVNEGIDAGAIIVQKAFYVSPNETFYSLVRKNQKAALPAMIEALDKIEKGSLALIPNSDEESTYNSLPTLRDALRFRLRTAVGYQPALNTSHDVWNRRHL